MAVVGKRDAYTQIDGRVGACAHLVAVEGGLFHVNPAGFSPSNGKVSPGFQAWAAASRGRVRGRGAVRGRVGAASLSWCGGATGNKYLSCYFLKLPGCFYTFRKTVP